MKLFDMAAEVDEEILKEEVSFKSLVSTVLDCKVLKISFIASQ